MDERDDLEQMRFPDVDPHDGAPLGIPNWNLSGLHAALLLIKVLRRQGFDAQLQMLDASNNGASE